MVRANQGAKGRSYNAPSAAILFPVPAFDRQDKFITLVLGVIAGSSAPGTLKSMKENSIPIAAAATLLCVKNIFTEIRDKSARWCFIWTVFVWYLKNRLVPPYTSSIEITWSPVLSIFMIVAVQQEPDPKASATNGQGFNIIIPSSISANKLENCASLGPNQI